jgi:hypothetical protein
VLTRVESMRCRLTCRVRKTISALEGCRPSALAVPHIQRNTRTSAQRISYADLLEVAKEAAEAGAKVCTGFTNRILSMLQMLFVLKTCVLHSYHIPSAEKRVGFKFSIFKRRTIM